MKSCNVLVLTFVVASFAMLTGCSGTQAGRGAAAPVGQATVTMDASWSPREEVDFAISEDTREASPKKATTSASFRPNRENIPQKGAVRAAVN